MGVSTLYNAAGIPFVPPNGTQPVVVKIPTPDGTGTSAPTGTVFNATTGFLVGPSAKAMFLFVTEDGNNRGMESQRKSRCGYCEESGR
jgi:hypothetical protein